MLQNLPSLPVIGSLYSSEVYVCSQSYEQNYHNGPRFFNPIPPYSDIVEQNLFSPFPSSLYRFHNFFLNNPLGVSAGPLLNAKWVKFYLDMGFAVPTYKTVRSVLKQPAPPPHCVYLDVFPKAQIEAHTELKPDQTLSQFPECQSLAVPPSDNLAQLSIANSFGVPSMEPAVWMPDLELANSYCGDGQLLIVSVMGTEGAEGRNLLKDFGYTAAMARDAGAKVIEANLSCPNLASPAPHHNSRAKGRSAGMLYADAPNAACIAREIRQSIGKDTPLLLKTGYLAPEQLEALLQATRPYVDGYTGINTLRGNVRQKNGALAFPNRLKVGISGAAIRPFGSQFVRQLALLRKQRKDDFAIVAVGGMMEPNDLDERLGDGADLAMSATAAMWDPYLALRWLAKQKEKQQGQ